jgi:probable lipoprotein NlpC
MSTVLATRNPLVGLVGIPYLELGRTHLGADCWGVCLLAARELWGVELPEYFYTEAQILEHACEHIRRETRGPRWTAIDQAAPGDIHIFRIKGFETHCGIAIGGGDFLHSLAGRDSCVESLRSLLWSHCLTGTYRWTP